MQIDKNNWQIKIDKDNLLEIRQFVKNNRNIEGGSYGHYLICSNEHITISPCKTTRCYNIPIITTDQFRKYILGKEDRKIIGYKAPFDMWDGHVKKGDTLVLYPGDVYSLSKGHDYDFVIPKEVVEAFFIPVYEEEEKVIELHGYKISKDNIISATGVCEKETLQKNITMLKGDIRHKNCMISIHEKKIEDKTELINQYKRQIKNRKIILDQYLEVLEVYEELNK